MTAVKTCSDETWLAVCREDPSCTFYQTPLWYRAVEDFAGGKPCPLLFTWPDKQAVLPLLKTPRGVFNLYHAPFGTYSGLVCPQVLKSAEIQEVLRGMETMNYHFAPSPFSHNPLPWEKGKENLVQVIDLDRVDPRDPILIWDREQRRRTRVAAKRGVSVRLAKNEADVNAFYDIYQKKLNRWGSAGTSYYPRELFLRLWESLGGTSYMLLWLAFREQVLVGGYLAFYWNRHMVAWHGGADNENFKHGVSQFLFKHMLEDTVKRRFKYFDLTMSGGHEGVLYYKDQLGTRRVPFQMAHHQTSLYGLLKKVKNFSRG